LEKAIERKYKRKILVKNFDEEWEKKAREIVIGKKRDK
jgi:CobQ-like glutamine amidotransferase family enzyme